MQWRLESLPARMSSNKSKNNPPLRVLRVQKTPMNTN